MKFCTCTSVASDIGKLQHTEYSVKTDISRYFIGDKTVPVFPDWLLTFLNQCNMHWLSFDPRRKSGTYPVMSAKVTSYTTPR